MQLKISGVAADIKGVYGPYKNFMKFALPLKNNGKFYLSKIIAARYICLTVNDDDFEKADIELIDWMREEKRRTLFTCDDGLFNDIMKLCGNTLHACLEPHYLGNATIHLQSEQSQKFAKTWHGKTTDYVIYDGARRDREVWVGDLLPEIRTVWSVFRDKEVIENTFDVILCRMSEEGNIPASSISGCEFLEYNAWFLIAFREYILLSGAKDYLWENYFKLKKIAEFLEKSMQGGMLVIPQGRTWAWTLSRKGAVTGSNCVLAYAFYIASLLFKDEKELADHYAALYGELSALIMEKAFDSERHLLRDTMESGEMRYSLDSNALAIIFQIIPESETENVFNAMDSLFYHPYGRTVIYPKEPLKNENWVHNEHVWPFCVSMQVEALLKCGYIDRAIALVHQTWGAMVTEGADTCWEIIDGKTGKFMSRRLVEAEDDRDTWNSACHGWSAGLQHLFERYVAGIVPETYGYQICAFKPDFGSFRKISADIATGYGDISLRVDKKEGGYQIELTVPKDCFLHCECKNLFTESRGIISLGCRMVSGKYFFAEEAVCNSVSKIQ